MPVIKIETATPCQIDRFRKEQAVGRVVNENISKLPQHLQDIWCNGSLRMNKENFFNEAARYIDIPHPETWDGSIGDVEMRIKSSDDIDIFLGASYQESK